MTGRKYQYQLYPLSFGEMVSATSLLEERLLERRLVYALENVKKPALFGKLIQALALQIGSEVSFQEIGSLIGADNQTVEKYIGLLEKAFVAF